MLTKYLKKYDIKVIIYIICSLISFYLFLKINGNRTSTFHGLWSFTFFSWSFAIISEIKFEELFNITKMIKTIQGNINLVIKLVIVQLQLLSLCAIIYYNNIFLLSIVMSIIIFTYNIKILMGNDSEFYSLKFIKNLNLFMFLGFLYIFLKLSFIGAFFITFGMVISYFSINIYNSKIKIFKQFNYRELYNLMQFVSLVIFYRGGMEIPAN